MDAVAPPPPSLEMYENSHHDEQEDEDEEEANCAYEDGIAVDEGVHDLFAAQPTGLNGVVEGDAERQRTRRSTIHWNLIGEFTTEQDMMTERLKEKVSKRKTDELRMGRKVTYRCNKWKSTRCPFQMYALYQLDGRIALYRTGDHDHANSIKKMQKLKSYPGGDMNGLDFGMV
jgi:hypothetical protein